MAIGSRSGSSGQRTHRSAGRVNGPFLSVSVGRYCRTAFTVQTSNFARVTSSRSGLTLALLLYDNIKEMPVFRTFEGLAFFDGLPQELDLEPAG